MMPQLSGDVDRQLVSMLKVDILKITQAYKLLVRKFMPVF